MIILLKYFHDSRITVDVPASAHEVYSAKFAQLPWPFKAEN